MKKLSILVIATLLCCMTACDKDKNEPSQPSTGMENGYAWVDLGLSVKWATCNVGATEPEEYGNYFSWGETSPKTDYSWSTYKWCNGSYHSLTKYCGNSSHGTVDNKVGLDIEDDAAHVNWGGKWRMPTRTEQDELRSNCTWTWTTQNGVNGCKVTGKNGNSIFLPAAGSHHSGAGLRGEYWSRLRDIVSYKAYFLKFSSDGVDYGAYDRNFGYSVRPVCP